MTRGEVEVESNLKYRIIVGSQGKYIECLTCGMKSYHSEDIKHRYCGWCHRFHDAIYINEYVGGDSHEKSTRFRQKAAGRRTLRQN